MQVKKILCLSVTKRRYSYRQSQAEIQNAPWIAVGLDLKIIRFDITIRISKQAKDYGRIHWGNI